eukprot:7749741-Pyramimonas_sp.AAC.1
METRSGVNKETRGGSYGFHCSVNVECRDSIGVNVERKGTCKGVIKETRGSAVMETRGGSYGNPW